MCLLEVVGGVEKPSPFFQGMNVEFKKEKKKDYDSHIFFFSLIVKIVVVFGHLADDTG